jgi:magnesium chelatase family protein
MPLARTNTVIVVGVAGQLVEVEADISAGLPGMAIVGLADTAVGEARDRARSAVINSGHEWPNRRITVGLSPAAIHKRGSALDLAIAIAVLAAAGQVPVDELLDLVVVGELGLDGRVRPIRGALPIALAARDAGLGLILPRGNVREAKLVPDLAVRSVCNLAGLVALLRAGPCAHDDDDEADSDTSTDNESRSVPDLRDVRGHPDARFSLELAAAGAHHIAMVGPPGIGKTLLAERLPGILPPLSADASLVATSIHSIAGRLPESADLIRHPPFIAPHHTASLAALVGGGSGTPKLGLVSLAHNGVLFLDEAPEFDQSVLDALRQPLEAGEIVVSRSGFSLRLPARFQLVLAANPCPCGHAGAKDGICTCSSLQRRRYLARLSGPLLDRIDVRLQLEAPTLAELRLLGGSPESSEIVAARVLAARERALRRLRDLPWHVNAEVPTTELRRLWPLPADVLAPAEAAFQNGRSSVRGLDRVVRLAWTVADLTGHDRPTAADVDTAVRQRDGHGKWAA